MIHLHNIRSKLAKKRRKNKRVVISLTAQKAELFYAFCQSKHTSPNKYLRKVIDVNLAGFKGYVKPVQADPKQLGIFDFIEP